MKSAVVYHRFNLNPAVRNVWEDRHSPILASIATLRAVNKDVKIYVLDTEPFLECWGDFPYILDFTVVQQPPQIPVKYTGGHEFQARMISRIWDVWRLAQLIPEKIVLYSDSDVFWLKNPFPLPNAENGFHGDVRGDGLFYFRTDSIDTEIFVHTWMGLTLAGSQSEYLRIKMRITDYHLAMYFCETSYCYLVRHGMTRGFSSINPLYHYFLSSPTEPFNPEAMNYHAHSGQFGFDRLTVAQRIHEFSGAIKQALPDYASGLLLAGTDPDTPVSQIANVMMGRENAR